MPRFARTLEQTTKHIEKLGDGLQKDFDNFAQRECFAFLDSATPDTYETQFR